MFRNAPSTKPDPLNPRCMDAISPNGRRVTIGLFGRVGQSPANGAGRQSRAASGDPQRRGLRQIHGRVPELHGKGRPDESGSNFEPRRVGEAVRSPAKSAYQHHAIADRDRRRQTHGHGDQRRNPLLHDRGGTEKSRRAVDLRTQERTDLRGIGGDHLARAESQKRSIGERVANGTAFFHRFGRWG